MRRLFTIMLSAVLAMVFCACAPAKKEQRPTNEEVQKRAQEAAEDLKDEEEKREDDE